MAYDELSLTGSNDDLIDLQEKYTAPSPVSQIPGQTPAGRPQEARSLRDRAVLALSQANPLMMGRSLVDTTRSLVGGMAVPVAAPISAGVQALNAAPGNIYRRSRGEEEVKTPSAEELMQKYGEAVAPRTEMGENFIGGVNKLMDVLKVPAAFPVAPNIARRPMLTPTDVRVGAGQAKQLARELREAPQDFQNAQSGLKRQNLYGEETLGVKAQAAAESLGDTLERRRSSGKSAIPGVPGELVPETNLYAVRPKGTSLIQPKVPETAKGYDTQFDQINKIIRELYGDKPAAKFTSSDIMSKYGRAVLEDNRDLRQASEILAGKKALELFPDAPTPRAAYEAYEAKYSDQEAKIENQLSLIEEVLNSPEGAVFREQGIPTPTEFRQRLAEAERVIKGPFVNYITKNIGTEGNPTLKLARQGITIEDPEEIASLSTYTKPQQLAEKRIAAGFPAEGSFNEEMIAKLTERDKLQSEIAELEAVRQPIFERAHSEGIDPATIPEFAESTNPLRQKLRQLEKVKEDVENITVATNLEKLEDELVQPLTKAQALDRIPYEERQFFPSVTKAGENEMLYATPMRSLMEDMGYRKLGRNLLRDITEGKAGDTSKLTIENYIREKGLAQKEERRAAKLKEQTYRADLETALMRRLKDAPDVQNFGGASVITLNKNTPKDVAVRDMSTDTAILDHCVGQCGSAPQGRKNVLTGKQQNYEPLVDPITGEPSKTGVKRITSYIAELESGSELASIRDTKTGLPGATIQFVPYDSQKFVIGYASGAQNRAVDEKYVPAIRDYLNSRADSIRSTGNNLADNTGIYDSSSDSQWKQVTREANLTENQRLAVQQDPNLPRFVTVKDVKEMSKSAVALNPPTPPAQMSRELADLPYELFQMDVDAQDVPNFQSIENTIYGLRNGVIDHAAYRALPENQRAAAMNTTADQLQVLVNERRAEMEGGNFIGDWEPEPNHPANLPAPAAQAPALPGDAVREIVSFVQAYPPEELGFLTMGPAVDAAMDGIFGNRLQEMRASDIAEAQGLVIDLARARNQNLAMDLEATQARLPAPAGQPRPVMGSDPYDLATLYNVPPGMIRSILTEASGPTDRLIALQSDAIDGADRFATLPNESILGIVSLIDDILAERRREQERLTPIQQPAPANLPAPQAPAGRGLQPVANMAPILPVIRQMGYTELLNSMSPQDRAQATDIATQYFNDNTFGPGNADVETFTNVIRSSRAGLHADAPDDVRELAARTLRILNEDAIVTAEDFADAIIEMYQDEFEPPGMLRAIQNDMSQLQRRGAEAWESVVGPASEETPWNPTLQDQLIRRLQNAAIELENEMADRDPEQFAKGGRVATPKAKKPRMAMVVTRKNPELTEMAYRYGGMVL